MQRLKKRKARGGQRKNGANLVTMCGLLSELRLPPFMNFHSLVWSPDVTKWHHESQVMLDIEDIMPKTMKMEFRGSKFKSVWTAIHELCFRA